MRTHKNTLNLRGGLALVRSQLFGFVAERGFFWTLAMGWMTGPVIYMLVWLAAAGSTGVGAFDRNDFVVYYLCLIFVNQLTYPTSHWSTAQMIEEGSVSTALLRPMPIVYGAIATDVSTKVVCVPFVAVVLAILGAALRADFSVGAWQVLTCIPALLLAQYIRFMLAYIISLLAFWTQRIQALLSVNDTFVFLLAGQVAPIALFPGALAAIATALPYRYMLSFPIEVLMGKLAGAQVWQGLCMQLFWAVALFALHHIVYKRGIRRYGAVGG